MSTEARPSVAAKRLRKAAPWAAGESLISAGTTLASTLIVARLLQPSDFGVAALALTAPALLIALIIAPIAQAFIRTGKVDTASNDRTFTLLALIGVASVFVCAIGGLGMAQIYASPGLPLLATAAGLDCMFTALAAVPGAILTRKLRTRTLTFRTLGYRAATFVATVGLAIAGMGAWAIIGGMLAGSATSCVLLWCSQPRLPRVRRPTGLRELLTMGLWISAEQGIATITVRGFVLLFGHFHGLTALGYLNFAIRLVEEAARLITTSVTNVALAFFSAGARAGRDLSGLFLRGTHGVMLVAAPMLIGLAAVTPDLVPTLFSAKWVAAVPAVQLLCLFSTISLSRTLAPALLRALGVQRALTYNAVLALVATAIATWFTRDSPLVIAMIAYGARTIVTMPVGFRQIARATNATVRQQLGAMLIPLACAAVMAASVLLVRHALLDVFSPVLRLALMIITGAVVYVALIALVDRKELNFAISWWRQRER